MVILYADDDDDDRHLFSSIIKQIEPSCKILDARDGVEALRILAAPNFQPPEFIFLDINMPLMDGFETLVKIRKDKRYRHTRIVMYSSGVIPSSMEIYQAINVQFVKKSNNATNALEIIRSVISGNMGA